MEQSGLIESDCKLILLFEKAQMEESQNVVISNAVNPSLLSPVILPLRQGHETFGCETVSALISS